MGRQEPIELRLRYGTGQKTIHSEKVLLSAAEELLAAATPYLASDSSWLEVPGTAVLPPVRLPFSFLERLAKQVECVPVSPGGTGGCCPYGYLALEVLTRTFGGLMARSWGQLLSICEVLAQEMEASLAQAIGTQPHKGNALIVEAELVVLWFHEGSLCPLHFDQLEWSVAVKERSVDAAVADRETLALPSSLPPAADTHLYDRHQGSTHAVAARAAGMAPAAACERGARHASVGTSEVRAVSDGYCLSLMVTVALVNINDEPCGELQIPVSYPPLTVLELAELVRDAAGVGRALPLRLAYRVVSSSTSTRTQFRTAGAATSASEGSRSATMPTIPSGTLSQLLLMPLESNKDTESFIESILRYGSRYIQLVLAYPSSSRSSSLAGMSTPLTAGQERRAPSRNSVGVPMPADLHTPKSVAVTPSSAMATGCFTRYCIPRSRSRRSTSPMPELRQEPARADRTKSETTSVLSKLPPHEVLSRRDAPCATDRNKHEFVVAHYSANPTELYISGPLSETVLLHLSDAIYQSCCCDNGVSKSVSMSLPTRPLTVNEFLARPRFLRIKDSNGMQLSSMYPTYVLRLAGHDFDDDKMTRMEMCVAEAIGSLEGFEPLLSMESNCE